MTTLMAIVFFVAGGICLTKPSRIIDWLNDIASRMRGKDAPSHDAAKNPGLVFFIRVVGFLALINAVMLLFVASVPVETG